MFFYTTTDTVNMNKSDYETKEPKIHELFYIDMIVDYNLILNNC